MSNIKHSVFSHHNGFTLVEVLIASAISTLVVVTLITFFISTFSYWHRVNLRMDADSDANLALSRIVYGMGDRLGLRTISKVTNFEKSDAGWTLAYVSGGEDPPPLGEDPPQENSFVYSVEGRSIIFNPGEEYQKIAGRDIKDAQLTVNDEIIPDDKANAIKTITNAKMITVKLCVEKEHGNLKASREIETTVHFRNTREIVIGE